MQTTSCTWPYVVPIGEDPAAHGHWCAFTDLYHTIPYHTRAPFTCLSLAPPAHADPDLMRVELKRHDPAAQRVNTTPLQATDRAILAGFNDAYLATTQGALTMGGRMCYPPHGGNQGRVSHV